MSLFGPGISKIPGYAVSISERQCVLHVHNIFAGGGYHREAYRKMLEIYGVSTNRSAIILLENSTSRILRLSDKLQVEKPLVYAGNPYHYHGADMQTGKFPAPIDIEPGQIGVMAQFSAGAGVESWMVYSLMSYTDQEWKRSIQGQVLYGWDIPHANNSEGNRIYTSVGDQGENFIFFKDSQNMSTRKGILESNLGVDRHVNTFVDGDSYLTSDINTEKYANQAFTFIRLNQHFI